ncbi:Ankyrin repeats (many copies) [Phytophthora infestans]|uniref:Ankyrin repeats (Many copies) n=1 Tax=Phytophthora infestans TaxID=4787 RepID=A0A833T0L7_PHYIN|nr:Ankyrin repeats (many copies) [Phytophthora infestans]
MALAAHESERQLVPVEDVNATDAYGYTMLLFAARDGDLRSEIARLLLERGASVNTVDDSGKTPLMRASANGEKKIVRLFLKHDANTTIRDAFGWNAERLAASAGHSKIFVTLQKHKCRRSASPKESWAKTLGPRVPAVLRRFFSALSETLNQRERRQAPIGRRHPIPVDLETASAQ